MKRYTIIIRWRGYRWTLQGIARHSVDLICAMIDHFPPGAFVTVRPKP